MSTSRNERQVRSYKILSKQQLKLTNYKFVSYVEFQILLKQLVKLGLEILRAKHLFPINDNSLGWKMIVTVPVDEDAF